MKNIIWSSGHKIQLNNIVHSDNCYVYDTDGKRYVDLESGVWCTSVGHNNYRVNQAILAQVGKIMHSGFCYCHPQIEKTAARLLEITDFQKGKCEFLCSGSEAIEYAMRIARKLSDKPLAFTSSESYFGAYGDAAAKNNESWFIYDRLNCGCNNKQGCTGNCNDFKNIPFEKVGIFLFEPGSSSGLVRFPLNELIVKIVRKIRENHGIIVANEITTGIGRTGKWFGYQHYSIAPDIVAMGKGIGNGYPVSATAISEKIAKKLEGSGFLYAQSHQNDPLGAAVAFEVISYISDEKLLEKCRDLEDFLINGIQKLDPEKKYIKEVRGRGLMIAIEFVQNAQEIYQDLIHRGFIVAKRANSEVLRLDPALTIQMETLEYFIGELREILSLKTSENTSANGK